MTAKLQVQITEIEMLSDDEQDAIALKIEDILDDIRWDKSFANSQDLLKQMGDEAAAAYHRGESLPLAFDEA